MPTAAAQIARAGVDTTLANRHRLDIPVYEELRKTTFMSISVHPKCRQPRKPVPRSPWSIDRRDLTASTTKSAASTPSPNSASDGSLLCPLRIGKSGPVQKKKSAQRGIFLYSEKIGHGSKPIFSRVWVHIAQGGRAQPDKAEVPGSNPGAPTR